MIRNILLICLTLGIFTGCFFDGEKKEEWTSYIYPDKTNTKRSMISPTKFPTFATCRDVSLGVLKEKGLETKGTFKCGKNCSYHEGMKVDICEEMRQ
ncbi:hypothetical protein Arnit_1915 [Arcobacter nitrofigilis DSM 7299]|uniref:Lipoprotein n=1 Tax=Arcobacter nitrofigilis (strain ATCC 33309 / DSM 7299 / CCUG 15893 / LMG 7604 / NCTC 12251 / CI) TaxID=572480 RepID=D5V1Y5_ARCNC|nr:hypothetical protein [Arcobacter nitrofigilis]ADG93569.1 hypothetical protein Arnit_1915 [Arcobacter nitrofigilis DSM 7299]